VNQEGCLDMGRGCPWDQTLVGWMNLSLNTAILAELGKLCEGSDNVLERWLQREKVHAIHKRDLMSVLEGLGLLEELTAGLLSCDICGAPIDLDTLQCLFMEDNQIRLCCTNVECYQRVLSEKGVSG